MRNRDDEKEHQGEGGQSSYHKQVLKDRHLKLDSMLKWGIEDIKATVGRHNHWVKFKMARLKNFKALNQNWKFAGVYSSKL